MQNIESESYSAEKERMWFEERENVDNIADKLGKGVDEGIKESVTALRVLRFQTVGSCEGHTIEEKRQYPWIQIRMPEPEGWQENEELQEEWTIANLKEQKRMFSAFEEFYRDRDTLFDARLSFKNIGKFGAFRIQSGGAHTMKLLSLEEQKQKLELYKKEMNDFTDFLKKKFFECESV